jgi:hypothetical protein
VDDKLALTAALRGALGDSWDRDALVRRARRCSWVETVDQARDELDRALKAYS